MKNDTAYDEMHAYKRDGPTDNFLALIDLGITHPDCRLCIVLADRQRRHEREDKPKDRPCTCKDKGSGACTGCWDTTQGQELSLKCLWCGVFGEQIGSCTTSTFGSAANLSSSTYPAGRHSINMILLVYYHFVHVGSALASGADPPSSPAVSPLERSIYMTHPLSVEALHAKIHSVFGSDYKPVWTLERPSYRKKLDNGTWDRAHQPLRVHKIYPAGSTTKDALFSPIPDPFTIAGPPQDKEFRKWVAEHPCGELEVIFV